MSSSRRVTASLAADLTAVLVFVLIGRASHGEDPVIGTLVTFWPFAVGVLLGWAAARAWRAPTTIVPVGLVVWIVTVAGGMLLRAVSGQGVQPGFVVVTAVVLGVFLLGWRLAVRLVRRRRAQVGRDSASPSR